MNDNMNYYDLLGIDKNASEQEIKKQYRELAKKWHPDINKSSDAPTMIKKLNEAKETLLDEDKRKEYDAYLSNYKDKRYENVENTYNRTNNSNYNNTEKTYTKWQYFKEYLKYYNDSKQRKVLAFILVMLETIICGTLQLLNYMLAFTFSVIGPVISSISSLIIGLFIVVIILDLVLMSGTTIINNNGIFGMGISIFILLIISIAPNYILRLLVDVLPNLLANLNMFLFKKSVGYKD